MLLHKLGIILFVVPAVYAQTVVINMATVGESTVKVGNVTAKDTKYGLLITPNLNRLVPSLTPGPHGFHVHVTPSCANDGLAAGGHLDPAKTNHHHGPYAGTGHLGDLPILIVNADGLSNLPVLAPRLKVRDILGHSLMIHNGGDNYSDNPPLGGGGLRMICGVITAKVSRK